MIRYGILLTVILLASNSHLNAACVAPDDGNFASIGGGCEDLATGNVWSNTILSSINAVATQGGAVTYCDRLVEGGRDDWRLPTIAELQTVGANGGLDYLDLTYGSTDAGYYWSSTLSKNRKSAYAYRFALDTTVLLTLRSAGDVICLRNGGIASAISVPEPTSLGTASIVLATLWMRRRWSGRN